MRVSLAQSGLHILCNYIVDARWISRRVRSGQTSILMPTCYIRGHNVVISSLHVSVQKVGGQEGMKSLASVDAQYIL